MFWMRGSIEFILTTCLIHNGIRERLDYRWQITLSAQLADSVIARR